MNRVLRFARDWPLLFYNFALILCAPVVLVLKAIRYFKKGWKREYDMARWTIPVNNSEQSTPRVVLIGTGWGEMQLVELLDNALQKQNPALKTAWVLREREAVLAARAKHPEKIVTWLPFDFLFPVLVWLKKLNPEVAVFTEKFWFPNLVRGLENWGAKIVVINARTRSHESSRYKIFEAWHRHLMRAFDALVFQSEQDLERAQKVLAPQTKTVAAGNLKFALRPIPDEARRESLERWLEDRGELYAVGSVEESDIEFIFEALDKLIADDLSYAQLLIAPRRLHLTEKIIQEAYKRNWNFHRRTEKYPETSGPIGIYILDTLGELAAAYEFCDAAFIGGTLKSGAGHNVVEPLVFGVPVSYGPNRGFFESVQIACEEAGVGFRVRTPDELASHWRQVMGGEIAREEIEKRAAQLLNEQSRALQVNVEAVSQQIELAEKRRAS